MFTMLRACSYYGVQHDIVFHTKKSVVMIVKFPSFHLSD